MGLLSKIFRNTRKPEGTLGRMFTKSMNTSVHAKMADWGLSFLTDVTAGAFETVYFWPGLTECFSQVYKTLKDGGHFLIVNEADGEDGTNEKWEKIIDMTTYTRAELEDALKQAGFSSVSTHHHETKPWIAVLAGK